MRPKIGILGGIGPISSAKFYELLIQKFQHLQILSNTDYPHIILESIPAPELLLENPDLTMYTEGLINLEKAGADFIVIVCNTAHIFLNDFQKLVKVPILDLDKEVERVLIDKKIKSIIIFGSQKTSEKLFQYKGITHQKLTPEQNQIVEDLILTYNRGLPVNFLENKFIEIVSKYPKENIVIACTELSIVLKNRGLEYLDTFEILLNATLNKWNAI